MFYYLLHSQDCSSVSHTIGVSHPSQVPPAEEGYEWTRLPDDSAYTVEETAEGVEVVPIIPVPDIEGLKAALSKKIDSARDAWMAAGVTTDLGTFQADDTSRINVAGAVSMAILAPNEFTIDWRLSDNSICVLNASQMISVGQAMGAFVNATYQRSFELKTDLAALYTIEGLNDFIISFEAAESVD